VTQEAARTEHAETVKHGRSTNLAAISFAQAVEYLAAIGSSQQLCSANHRQVIKPFYTASKLDG
jgi:hypothetical protein